jgi:predicted ferric reductase
MKSGLFLAMVTAFVVAIVLLFGLGGWRYYTTPLDVRAYTDLHPILRPSGTVGRWLGVVGLSLMLLMHVYTLRKKIRWLSWMGPVPKWLEFHIFCGFLGPVLITFHTSFKFNGIVSVAYWSMMIVMFSGFVGRYLYMRIPRTLRGEEMSRHETAEKAERLKQRLAEMDLRSDVLTHIETFERRYLPPSDDATWGGLLFGEVRFKLGLARLRRRLRASDEIGSLADETTALISEHAVLIRRIAFLKKTKRLFDLWRLYHKPLAVLMAVIVVLHVAVVWYFGYAFSMG